ncbi:MAG: glycosyltransferase family 2 protein [Candidatus Dormibacteria bacterium]
MAPGPPGPTVSVLICTFQSSGEVEAALRSCLDQGLPQERLVVVDNHSDDGSADLVAQEFPSVRLIRLERNLGFARANNLAARQAAPGDLLLLNPDARLGEGALATMRAALAADPRRGAISPRIDRPDGSLDRACHRSFPTLLSAFWRLGGLSRLRPSSSHFAAYNLGHLPPDLSTEIDSGTGACMLLRREAWERLGGFDEGFFMYGEDLDLCWRLRHQLGLCVWYEAQARVLHLKGQSSQQRALRMLVAFHRSMWRFYRLHYLQGARALWAPLVALGVLARLVILLALNRLRRHPKVSP